ncbi:hypothetical protein [Clostridium hydrogenum]|uniref:hypothetical protein n=1 Tax=Clostridium hydrogenum TaxID=2855764 RepID=UPI001F48AA1B|nr:hypothetical protein [Clostridium hydrogenum]
MKLIKTLKRLLLIFPTTLLILNTNDTIIAADNSNEKQLTFNNIITTSNGSIVKYTSNINNENYTLNLNINSKNLKKGYYTSNILSTASSNWANYGMISFDISNKSNSELRFNFVIRQANGTYLTVSNDKFVLIKKSNSNLLEKVSPSYGTISISKFFNGKIYIPFKNLGKEGLNKQDISYTVSEISSFGILETSAENEEKNFSLSNFKLIGFNSAILKKSNIDFSISGDDRVQIPVAGESIAPYKAYLPSKNEEINYKLEIPQKGVSIANDGILKIQTYVSPQKIKINAILRPSGIYVSKEISLYQSWTLSAKEVDGTSKSVPKANEVKSLLGTNYKFLLSSNVLNVMRIVLIIFALIPFILYFLWSKKIYK